MRRRAAALLGCVLVASACTSPAPGPTSTSSEPVAIDFVLAPEPAWRFDGSADGAEPDDVRLDGDHLIISRLVNMPFTVVDLATGTTAWELADFSGRLGPGITTRRLSRAVSGDGIVPVEFLASCFGDEATAACPGTGSGLDEAIGVAGHDLATGKPRWFRRLAGGLTEDQPGHGDSLVMQVDVAGVEDGTVVATLRMRAGQKRSDGTAAVVTYGLDAATGAVRWHRAGFLADQALGPLAIGVAVDPAVGPDDTVVGKGVATWSALDLATGRPAWRRTLDSAHRIVGRSAGVVVLQSESTGQVVVVETATGAEHDVGTPPAHIECPRQVVTTALACSHSQRDTADFILDFARPEAPKRSVNPIRDGGVTAQAGAVVFVATMPYRGLNQDREPSYAARLDGTRISALWPGTVVAASASWVVLGWAPKTGARMDAYAVASR